MRWFRWMHLGVVLALVGAVAMLSLAESPTGPPMAVVDAVSDLVSRLGQVAGNRQAGNRQLPIGMDKVLHFLGWGAVGFLATGLVPKLADRFSIILGLFTLSALFEVGQLHLTQSRSGELGDVVANGAGLAVGMGLFVVFWATAATTSAGRLLIGEHGPIGSWRR